MPVPVFPDIFNEAKTIDDQDVAEIANITSKAMAQAGYWQGRCEGQELTITYLKDCLNRLECRNEDDE